MGGRKDASIRSGNEGSDSDQDEEEIGTRRGRFFKFYNSYVD
jgi:hypothetical protein